jgi:hypothetical protein
MTVDRVLGGTFVIVCGLVVAASAGWGQTRGGTGPVVGLIKNTAGFLEGGCELLRQPDTDRSERYIFLSDLKDRAVMNLDGHDVRLTFVRRKEPEGEPKKGDQSSVWYRAGDVEVRVDFTVSGLCPPKSESCEAVSYRAIINLTVRGSTKTVAAHGICGV